jgi:hypothetical protein
MPSPPKKKRKKRSERGKKQSNASAPPQPQQKKSSKKKKESYRHWTEDEKKFRDRLIENAAEQIIEARVNNPKNKMDCTLERRMRFKSIAQGWR